ncbi:ribosomal protein S7 domain-containing protein [Mycena amicta]|nr:ribosomal protein S7 domain-containing protein [Mycena amicta]
MLSLGRLRISPRHARSMVSVSDRSTATNAMGVLGANEAEKEAPDDEEIPEWMLLPPLGADGRGGHRQPLLNIPPPEDPLLRMLASMIMKHGERAKATRCVSNTLLHIYTLTRAPPLPILRQAVLYASPAVKTVSRTHGAKIVHTPMALSEKQRTHYARPARVRKLEEKLAREMVDILQKVHASRDMRSGNVKWSGALEKKGEQHKFAMVNRGGVRIAPGAAKAVAVAEANTSLPEPDV